MKLKSLKYYIVATLMVSMFSCEKKFETYTHGAGLNFVYARAVDTLLNIPFVYSPSTATTDTVWLTVQTVGPVTDVDRAIALEQVSTGADDAVPGVHYVQFDDESLRSHYRIAANQIQASLPVILKRHPSLKIATVSLKVRIKTNENFSFSYPGRSDVRITFNDFLSKPNNWSIYTVFYLVGNYGPVKHKWLIDNTTERWDDEYLSSIGFTPTLPNSNFDIQYITYLQQELRKRLLVYNQELEASGKPVLKEADGTIVSF